MPPKPGAYDQFQYHAMVSCHPPPPPPSTRTHRRPPANPRFHPQASLVTTADRSRRNVDEPTGEAESLVGRINPKEMGARAYRQELNVDEKRKKAEKDRQRRERRELEGAATKKSRNTVAGGVRYGDVLEATQDRKLSALLLPQRASD